MLHETHEARPSETLTRVPYWVFQTAETYRQEQERIFQPGHRATETGAATAVASAGAGLGLALCRRLARSAGGDVQAQPSDSGARFVVRLPAA